MTIKQSEFLADLKSVLDKHDVTFGKTTVYYAGESEDPSFYLPDEDGALSYLSFEDMVDLRGGWRE